LWISTPPKQVYFNLTRQEQNTFYSTSGGVFGSIFNEGPRKRVRETKRLLPGGFPTWTPWRRCIRASSSLLQSWLLPYAAMSSGPPSISSLASFRHLHFCHVSLLCTEYSHGGADVHSATAHRVCINRSCLYAAGLCCMAVQEGSEQDH